MAVGGRIRRRHGEEEPAPETLDTPRSDHMAAAILSLQRSAGNRAVGSMLARTLTVRNVDFNPSSNRFVDSDVPARALITQIKASALYGFLLGPERQRLEQLGAQTLEGQDVTELATAIIGYLAAGNATRRDAIEAERVALLDAIGNVASTRANRREQAAFAGVQSMATSMSRSKGRPNVIDWANATPALQGAVTAVATRLFNRNQWLATLSYAARDPQFGCTGRASFGFQHIRSPHLNEAGWLEAPDVEDFEDDLNDAAHTWVANKAANGTAAEQLAIQQQNFPADVTSQAVESSGLSRALRQDYLNTGFAGVVATADQRITLAWARYVAQSFPGQKLAHIEFDAEEAGGVSRFVYDFVNDDLYANTHYNWVGGFNPFFLVQGGPAMR